MKYLKILLLLLFMGVLQTKGQEDSVMFKVAYKATFKGKQESELKEDFQVLEVGRKYSEYYSIYDREFQHKSDSLQNAGLSDIELASQLYGKNGPDKGETYQVFKNYPTAGKLTYTYVIFNFPYLYEEDMPAMKWDLAEGDSVIGGYACKKAVCELRGRKWTAWYTLDLPYSDGPWKLCGLPGLILAALESEGIYSFSFAGIEKCDYPMSFINTKKYERCTPKQLQDDFCDYCKNGSNWSIRKAIGISVPMGKTEKSYTPCLMEFYK